MHVTRSDGLTGADPAALAEQRRLTESLGGTYHQVVGDDIPEALLSFARAENATQLVLGASRRSWLSALLTGPGFGARTIRGSGDIDVHIVTHAHMGRGRGLLPRSRGGLTLRRRLIGYALAVALCPLVTLMLASLRGELNLTSDVLAFLVAVIAVALVGGFVPAILVAVAGSLLLNYYFTPPVHKFTIAEANNALALVVFVAVAIIVSSVVDTAARRTRQAARASAESELLVTTSGNVLRGQRALDGGARPGARSVRHGVGHAAGVHAQPAPRRAVRRRLARRGPLRRAAGGQAIRRRRRSAGGRDAVPGAARPLAARDGPPGTGRVRRLRRGGPGAAAAGGRGRGGPAHRRGGPDADRAARRGQPRPAHPAGLGQGRRDQPAVGRRAVGRGGPR